MFGKVASDLLGLSDVGAVIKPQDYDKVDADDYIMHEDQEKIYFLIKSKTDEYCFTNKALLHLDGTSAVSKKRTLRRYSYYTNKISGVTLETAGTVDLDVEIKFTIGSEVFSIDVHKKHLEELKDLYKSLIRIQEMSFENEITLDFAQQSLNMASTTLSRVSSQETQLVDQFKEINKVAFNWLVQTKNQYTVKDYGFVFDKYINN
ncbi:MULTISPECIES: PH domain-containing protein [unclassified Bacillus (in: firmicutes)]|uniref:PH domain-containing protein n=1 Tax=unclassified Bacillus (in: firmicutes) TaxID=185979 RepID=UPI0008DF5F71|nr:MULTISPECIES: PH domain-containing protein [unclassified Bacillus (in: firmicutes)]SFA87840.1 YvbH-like oligomerisation region [Bacillus sp. UNCCL13]SFQ84429.1 YvbH-like oligomerisation region [Bacillus sp. cl95]